MASVSDPDTIQYLDSQIVDDADVDIPKGARLAASPVIKSISTGSIENTDNKPLRHRMHRSAVRPFFCCGSEISLVSLVDSLDLGSKSLGDPSSTVSEADEHSGAALLPVRSHGNRSAEAPCTSCRRPSIPSRRKKSEKIQQNKAKKSFWKLRGKLGSRMMGPHSRSDSSQHQGNCVCTAYRKRSANSSFSGSGDISPSQESIGSAAQYGATFSSVSVPGVPGVQDPIFSSRDIAREMFRYPRLIEMSRVDFNALYPTRDLDEIRREERAREMEEGIEIAQQRWPRMLGAVAGPGPSRHRVILPIPHRHPLPGSISFPALGSLTQSSSDYEDSIYGDCPMMCLQTQHQHHTAHSQVEYIHCLVPDLRQITSCSFYWGVMDRYEAEKLLENKPEGTFLLRDSAQEDFLFSVSFRRYNRSLHARIEQWNHLFSFDAHDPAVFACDSVVGLIEHYKDPEMCMFFEPMLTLPLNRTSTFSLQHLCRAEICSNITYDAVNLLPLPGTMKEYLKYYHYKQKVRMRRLDIPS